MDIIEKIENGVPSAMYIRTLNIDEPLAMIKADGTVRYYQQDALGSVIALTDETGTIKTTYSYDPFGNTTILGEASDNPFQYKGRENDGTGLYYYRARYYSPELERFISEDLSKSGDINFYTYAWNNPVNYSGIGPLRWPGPPPPPPPPDLRPPPPGRAPGAGNPPQWSQRCELVRERYCVEFHCNGERIKDKCYISDIRKCYCVEYAYRTILRCPWKTYYLE